MWSVRHNAYVSVTVSVSNVCLLFVIPMIADHVPDVNSHTNMCLLFMMGMGDYGTFCDMDTICDVSTRDCDGEGRKR